MILTDEEYEMLLRIYYMASDYYYNKCDFKKSRFYDNLIYNILDSITDIKEGRYNYEINK